MLTQWLKDIAAALIMTLIINIFLFIINDQNSIIGTWEIEISENTDIPGNHYDILKFHPNDTFEHLTHEGHIAGTFVYHKNEIVLFYENQVSYLLYVDMDNKTMTSVNTGDVYKKITLIE